jgi:hypothetical protein
MRRIRHRGTTEAWDYWGQRGAEAVAQPLVTQVKVVMRSADKEAVLAIPVGAVLAASRLAHASCMPEGRMALEAILLATVRGAMRGSPGAVNEDGTPFEIAPEQESAGD